MGSGTRPVQTKLLLLNTVGNREEVFTWFDSVNFLLNLFPVLPRQA